jgi:hypothetical protein
VSWKKELVGWNIFRGRRQAITVEGFNSSIKYMTINRTNCLYSSDTLVFRKAQIFGLMFDKYNLGNGDNFWRIFGGKELIFNWRYDGSS